MPSKKEREALQRANTIRHLAAALPHADVYAVLAALEAFAAMLGATDRTFPDPLKRAMADDAWRLSEVCRQTNMARKSIPPGTTPALTVDERTYLVALLDTTVDAVGASIKAKLRGEGDTTKAVR